MRTSTTRLSRRDSRAISWLMMASNLGREIGKMSDHFRWSRLRRSRSGFRRGIWRWSRRWRGGRQVQEGRQRQEEGEERFIKLKYYIQILKFVGSLHIRHKNPQDCLKNYYAAFPSSLCDASYFQKARRRASTNSSLRLRTRSRKRSMMWVFNWIPTVLWGNESAEFQMSGAFSTLDSNF